MAAIARRRGRVVPAGRRARRPGPQTVFGIACAPEPLEELLKILFAEAEENNLDDKVQNERLKRWYTCSLCEQQYHGVVACALGWACWKTYLGRPETAELRRGAMTQLRSTITARP